MPSPPPAPRTFISSARIEEHVRAVAGLSGEVQLGGQHGLAGGLHLDVDVPGAAGVEAGHDRLEGEGAGGVAELVAAEGVPGHVVVAVVVGLPEVESTPDSGTQFRPKT